MYTEQEVEAIARRAASLAREDERRHLVEIVRAEVDRASRRLLVGRDAAAYLSMGKRRLYALADAGRVPFEDRGGSVGYVFDRADLDALAHDLTR